MSTPNFRIQKDFPLFVADFEPMDFEEWKKENVSKQDRIERSDEMLEDWYDDYCDDNERFFYEDFPYDVQIMIDRENKGLQWFEIQLQDGYHSGLQLYVIERDCPCDDEEEDKKSYKEEIKTVNEKLRKIANEYRFTELVCVGIFSNGEAFYQEANTLKAKVNDIRTNPQNNALVQMGLQK